MPNPPSIIDGVAVPKKTGSTYPDQYRSQVVARARARLGDLFDLTQFGVNIVTLPPERGRRTAIGMLRRRNSSMF
jgi:uncharacterized cupin superfamily protein